MDFLLSIVRRPEGLVARFSRRRLEWDPARIRPPDDPLAEKDTPSPVLSTDQPPYEIVELPMPQPGTVVPDQSRLIAAWNALCAVREANAETLYHVLLILLETVPDDSRPEGALPPLCLGKPEKRLPRPTAAHPRAYRGTKYRPPTPPPPTPMDLRPYLCGERNPKPVLDELAPWWDEATEKLRRVGLDTATIDRLEPGVDPALAHLPDAPKCGERRSFPRSFRSCFDRSLRGVPWSDVRALLVVCRDLDLFEREDLCAASARLARLCPVDLAARWLRLAADRPDHRQLPFLTALIETGAYDREPARLSNGALEELDHLAPDTHYLYWIVVLFREFRRGVPVDYLLQGFRYAAERAPGKRFLPPDGPIPDLNAIRMDGLNRALSRAEPSISWTGFPLQLWDCVGEIPDLSRVLDAVDWEALTPEDAYHLLLLLNGQVWECPAVPTGRAGSAKWRFVRALALQTPGWIESIPPDYGKKFLKHLSGYLWEWDNLEKLERFLPTGQILLHRLARPPFRLQSDTVETLAALIEQADPMQTERLLSAPDASFLRLEQACALNSSAWLIAAGVEALSRAAIRFTIECFHEYPGKLCRTARLLGILPENLRVGVTAALLQHPLMTADFTSMSVEDASAFLRVHCGGRSPAPRALMEHLEGRRSMSSAQRERGRQEMLRRLNLSRLEVLETLVLQRMDEGIGLPAPDPDRHVLQLLYAAEVNRRPFRKFLRAVARGDQDYILRHPCTQQWIRDHPRIDLDLWLSGITLVRPVPEPGEVRLELERDPFEVLKLGTYVGSCYAIGGLCDYSPPAIALDVNKQVIYARDESGVVLGRQILAINENEELVCFSVYPQNASGAIQELFLDYDLRFAEALGLKIYDGHPFEHGVINVLGQAYWDDGAWELGRRTGAGRGV